MADKEMDSWDEEEKKEEEERQRRERSYRSHRWRAYTDLKRYRDGYPKDSTPQGAELSEMVNLEFYQNKKRYKPCGELIEVILDQWKDDYVLLEQNHSYIQWLFPLREQGMNSKAKMLTPNEIKMMKADSEVMRRFLEAYKLMLGFYGIKLVNEATGEVERASNFEKRFENLDYHSHNNLRITRILKCLGELGLERYQAPLVRFFLKETLVEKRLPNVKNSVLDYFMLTVKDKKERRDLVHFAWKKYEPQNKFIWGPIEKLKKYKMTENGSDVHIVNENRPEGKDGEQGNNKPNGKNAVMGEGDDSTRGDPSAVGSILSEYPGKVSDGEQEEGHETNNEATNRELDGSPQSRDGDDKEKGIHMQKKEREKPSNDVQAGRGEGDEGVQSPRRPGEENEGKGSEASSSNDGIERQEGSPDAGGSVKCRNEGDKEEVNDGEAESHGGSPNEAGSGGGSDADNKSQPKDPKKRKIDSKEGDVPPQSGSASYKELLDTLDQQCKIQAHNVQTEPEQPADRAKKQKWECDPSGDGGSVAGGGLQVSHIDLVALGSQDKMNVDHGQLPDKDGGKRSTFD